MKFLNHINLSYINWTHFGTWVGTFGMSLANINEVLQALAFVVGISVSIITLIINIKRS